jgi:peptidoglycan/xylan/chitin deacetylase (PgdA/CDA1 family)
MENFMKRYQLMRFPNGKSKAVTLSYDDGCFQDKKLGEIIDKYGIKCTFNLNSCRLADSIAKNGDFHKDLLANGHEVAVHGKLHKAPGRIRAIEGIRDVLYCREELEQHYDMIIRGMAYPDTGIRVISNGVSYENIRSYLSDLGIVYARTLGKDNDSFELPTDWYAWMPTAHHTNPQVMEYIDKFLNLDLSQNAYCAARFPKLFYLWGHAYEFDNNNNWELLEEICKKLGNRDDIWYATNIEIYNYVTAYNSLVYSADGNTVYNPTLVTLYFDDSENSYVIKPGETIKI